MAKFDKVWQAHAAYFIYRPQVELDKVLIYFMHQFGFIKKGEHMFFDT